ncbi:MAG TPA: hypothetical protein ENK04_04805 [Gammaproteobacteria bacterium]|nr:hypothetical protein [Gammaproteobacteria bacterium]
MVKDSCCPSFGKTDCFLENYRFISLSGKNYQFLIMSPQTQIFLGGVLNKTFILWVSVFFVYFFDGEDRAIASSDDLASNANWRGMPPNQRTARGD